MSAVTGSFVTLGLFVNNSVSLVSEDYYKEGKGINVDLSRIHVAKGFKLQANVLSTDNGLIVNLDKGELPLYPALTVTFTHRTLPGKDFVRTVSSDANGNYRINLPKPLDGPWFLKLEPHNKEWTIQGKVSFPTSSTPTVLLD